MPESLTDPCALDLIDAAIALASRAMAMVQSRIDETGRPGLTELVLLAASLRENRAELEAVRETAGERRLTAEAVTQVSRSRYQAGRRDGYADGYRDGRASRSRPAVTPALTAAGPLQRLRAV